MPLPTTPDLVDWPPYCQALLQQVAEVELFSRKVLPPLIVLTGLVLLAYLLVLAAREVLAWQRWRQQTRVSRLAAKFQKVRERIAGAGRRKRLRLACSRQRCNLKEFALLVKKQLRAIKWRMPRHVVRQTSACINNSVRNLDFDRLYSLHHLLSQADTQQVAPRLEKFFRQAR